MGKVNDDLIHKLSNLARLNFNKNEAEKMKSDLSKILSFIKKLSKVETKDIKPLVHINKQTNIMRDDIVSDKTTQKEALLNAPKKDSDYFKVPTVLKK